MSAPDAMHAFVAHCSSTARAFHHQLSQVSAPMRFSHNSTRTRNADAASATNQRFGTPRMRMPGSLGRVFATTTPMIANMRLISAVDWEADHYEEIPVLVVACPRWTTNGPIVSGWRPPFPPFLASIYYGSIFPAVQNLLLGARAAGLGASLTVMPLWSVALARRVLSLPLWVSPVAVIPIGWPLGRYGVTTRKPVGDAVHFDRYGNRPYRGMTADAAETAA